MILWRPTALGMERTTIAPIGDTMPGDSDALSERLPRYLDNARRARARAKVDADPDERRFDLLIAAGWERLADNVSPA